MKLALRLSLPAVMATVILLFAGGLDAQASKFQIKKADGTVVEGKVIEDTGTFIKVKNRGKTVALTYVELHPETIYHLRNKRTKKDDATAQFSLAEYALKHKLFHAARQNFFNAVLADPNEASKKKAISGNKRVDAAQCRYLYEVAVDAKKKGNRQLESVALSHLVTSYPGSPECKKAEKMLAELKVGGEAGDVIERLSKRLQKEVAEAKVSFEKAIEENQKGLQASRKMSKAEHHFERAVKHVKKCMRVVATVKKQYPQDKEVQARVVEAETKIRNLQVEILVNISHIYSSRQSMKKALNYANQAIALDPKSQLARNTRNQIELMTSYNNRGFR